MGADIDWNVMCSSVPVGVRPSTWTRTAGVCITRCITRTQRLHSPSRIQTRNSTPAVRQRRPRRFLCNSAFQKLYLSDRSSAWVLSLATGAERGGDGVRGEEERERQEREAVSNHGSTFFVFFSSKSASENVYLLMVQAVRQALLRFQSWLSILLLWGFPFVQAPR